MKGQHLIHFQNILYRYIKIDTRDFLDIFELSFPSGGMDVLAPYIKDYWDSSLGMLLTVTYSLLA